MIIIQQSFPPSLFFILKKDLCPTLVDMASNGIRKLINDEIWDYEDKRDTTSNRNNNAKRRFIMSDDEIVGTSEDELGGSSDSSAFMVLSSDSNLSDSDLSASESIGTNSSHRKFEKNNNNNKLKKRKKDSTRYERIGIERGKSSFKLEDWEKEFGKKRLQREDGREWTEPPPGEGGVFEPKWRNEEELRRQLLENDPNYIFLNEVAGRSNATVETLYEEGDVTHAIFKRQGLIRGLQVSIEETRTTLKELTEELRLLGGDKIRLQEILFTQKEILLELELEFDFQFRLASVGYQKTASLVEELKAKKILIEKRVRPGTPDFDEEIWKTVLTLVNPMLDRADISPVKRKDVDKASIPVDLTEEPPLDLKTIIRTELADPALKEFPTLPQNPTEKESKKFTRTIERMKDIEGFVYIMWWLEDSEDIEIPKKERPHKRDKTVKRATKRLILSIWTGKDKKRKDFTDLVTRSRIWVNKINVDNVEGLKAKKSLLEKRIKLPESTKLDEETWKNVTTLVNPMVDRSDIPEDMKIEIRKEFNELKDFPATEPELTNKKARMEVLEGLVYLMWWIEDSEDENIPLKEELFLIWNLRLVLSENYANKVDESKKWLKSLNENEIIVHNLVSDIDKEKKKKVEQKSAVLDLFWHAAIFLIKNEVLALRLNEFFHLPIPVYPPVQVPIKEWIPLKKPNDIILENLYKKYGGTLFSKRSKNIKPLNSYYMATFQIEANKITNWIEEQQRVIEQLRSTIPKSAAKHAKAQKLENAIIRLQEGEPLSITLAYYRKILTNDVEKKEGQLDRINTDRNEIRKRLKNLRSGKATIKDLPVPPYTHDREWVEAPEHSGIVRIKPIVTGAITQAYGKMKREVRWARRKEVTADFLQKDPEIYGDFAELVGLEISKVTLRFQKQYQQLKIREFSLQDSRTVMLNLKRDYDVKYMRDEETDKTVLRGYRILPGEAGSQRYRRDRFTRDTLPDLFYH